MGLATEWLNRALGPRWGPYLQSQGELKERKSKEMKAKLLSFPFINFSESRLFRALRRKK
jgi:hypothetical protein